MTIIIRGCSKSLLNGARIWLFEIFYISTVCLQLRFQQSTYIKRLFSLICHKLPNIRALTLPAQWSSPLHDQTSHKGTGSHPASTGKRGRLKKNYSDWTKLLQKSVSEEVQSEKPKSTGAIPKSISFDKNVKSRSNNETTSPTAEAGDWQDADQAGHQVCWSSMLCCSIEFE